MPTFEYKGLDSSGKQSKGLLDAENIRAARQKLRKQNIFPTDIKENTGKTATTTKDVLQFLKRDSISAQELSIMTRQLATLIGAGLPLVSALNALADQTESLTLRRIVISVKEQIEEGSTFAKAIGNYPKAFPRLYTNMVHAGETSGTLQTVLENLAEHLEAQVALRSKIRSALIYPVVMLSFCFLVVIGLFIFVIPNIVEIFTKQGATLPLPTQIMIAISDFLIAYWWSIPLMLIAAVMTLRWYYKRPDGRARIDTLLLRAPIIGGINLKINTARIALTLGALLKSGVQLLSAIDITRKMIGNIHVDKALEDARDGVKEGKSLAAELKKSNIFPPMLYHMVAVGEKSGTLEAMLLKAGDAYETEVNNVLEGLTSLLEPILMIFVGSVVLSIVVSVMLPMADLINVIQK
jgi:general secretion pathway protein F